MVKCCAPLCGNASYRKLPDITFHRFPKDVNLKNAWLAKIGRKNWQPKPSSVFGSNHFEAHLVDFVLYWLLVQFQQFLNYLFKKSHVYRYQAVLMRQRFDAIMNEKDMRKAAQMVEAQEKELFNTQHPIPRKFAKSPGGVAYERVVEPPDWVLDYWHPLEKAQYPEYFKKREQRKKEFIAMWEKQYGKPDPKDKEH